MRSKWFVVLALLMVGQVGCYTTRVVVPNTVPGPERSDRQWFTLAGLVRISGDEEASCPNGLAQAESQESATDIVISLLAPWLISSRTVRYRCNMQSQRTSSMMEKSVGTDEAQDQL